MTPQSSGLQCAPIGAPCHRIALCCGGSATGLVVWSGVARLIRCGRCLPGRPRRWFSVRAVPWHAFCGGAWSGLVAWLGEGRTQSRLLGSVQRCSSAGAPSTLRTPASPSRCAARVRPHPAPAYALRGLRLCTAGAAAGRRLQRLLQCQTAQQRRRHRRRKSGTNCAAGRQGRARNPQLVAGRARSRAQHLWACARRVGDDRPEPLPQLHDRRIDPERHGYRQLGVFRAAFE